jgi:hypothetical protein
MKKLILTAFIASSLITGPGMLMTSTGALAQRSCGPDAPEAWFRPGGYCDGIAAGKSLTLPGGGDEGCTSYEFPEVVLQSMADFKKGERVHVAVVCDCPTLPLGFNVQELPDGARLHVAQAECETSD